MMGVSCCQKSTFVEKNEKKMQKMTKMLKNATSLKWPEMQSAKIFCSPFVLQILKNILGTLKVVLCAILPSKKEPEDTS